MSSPRRSSSSRPLSLHPSALSDAEHPLFSSSLAELVDGDGQSDWARASVSAREARAWIRGRYAALASGVVDEIFRLFPPTLSAGEFFAVLRLVLHGLAGHGVQRSLVFVQASLPQSVSPSSSSLPTPAPSPDLHTRPPLPPRKPTLRKPSDSQSSSSSRSTTSASSARTAPSPSTIPPALSLRRTVSSSPTKTRAPVPDFATNNATDCKPTVHRAVSISHSPFRAPPRPPQRRTTTSVSVPTSPSEGVHSSPDRTPRTAPPTNNSFLIGRSPPPPPPPPKQGVYARVSQFEAAYGSDSYGQPPQALHLHVVDTGAESARWQPGGEAWGPL
ncbi:hypothetical protein FB45DRAFT_942847 [Roridomyces roridus]|uniref:Uncharacterized protein n=1 Tax=Roridomyces roridus TaxID=1738132 RepID=A0AAD7B5D2_9AGAR|nr:hypothetical protein FB45DRAFT_942847 [Roridomyces roridus]